MNQLGSQTKPVKSGFTLVEILTVIVIISILAGIAIPAISGALGTAKDTAIRVEIDVMSQALEAYKLEHGEYPPDFSDWAAVERHFRKAFPNIDNNELRILAQFTHYNSAMARTTTGGPVDPRTSSTFDHYPHAIDRAEALVFCLGGLSKDKKFPFTGQGGPLVLISGATLGTASATDYTLFQYNSERETGFFDFDPPQLSVTLVTPPAGAAFAYSDDEGAAIGATSNNDLGFTFHPDPFPVYRPAGSDLPLVYFAGSSYQRAFGVLPTASTGAIAWNSSPANGNVHHFQSVYMPASAPGGSAETGAARPYVSNIVDTTPPSTMSGFPIPATSTVLQFAEDGKFQIISSGRDNNYGGTLARNNPSTSLALAGATARGIGVYPSGELYNPFSGFTPAGAFASVSSVDKYQDDNCLETYYSSNRIYASSQPQLDNITNFATRTLESDLP